MMVFGALLCHFCCRVDIDSCVFRHIATGGIHNLVALHLLLASEWILFFTFSPADEMAAPYVHVTLGFVIVLHRLFFIGATSASATCIKL